MMTNATLTDTGVASRGVAPRVLMALWDGGGNVGPQRALVRELTRQGCQVHAVVHDAIADRLRADGATVHPLRTAQQFDFAAHRTLEDEMTVLPRDILGSPRFAADVMAVHDEVGPHVFVVDCMLVSTMRAAVDRSVPFCVVYHLAWLPHGDAAGIMNYVYRSMPGQPATADCNNLIDAASLVLATSYPEFADAAGAPPNFVFVGPVREPTSTAAWPRRYPDRPLVLASLSSVYQQQDRTLDSVVAALSSLPVEALVTTGRGVSPSAVDAADNVEVRSFVDHDGVLPLCDLVVTHGGLGTVSFSAGAGVPVLCLPNGRDQNDNAARVEALGLGRALAADAGPDRIAATVTGMLGDGRLRAACRGFAAGVSRFGDLPRVAELVRHQATAA